ncbi:MAG: hypothetical protein M2R45_01602 [Verrucomicrobia subdivision 3 bacterium]|nr:hypothetical protein [Limisphaerales bacterium]MCS1412754.1 hypothetical protein [Limisphaerales bacterium]
MIAEVLVWEIKEEGVGFILVTHVNGICPQGS